MQENTALKRWKLILGSSNVEGEGADLSLEEQQMDAALGALYEFEHSGKFEYQSKGSKGSSGKSNLTLSKWLGDIRNYFPNTVVQVLVDARGQVIRATLLPPGSSSPEADQTALKTARNLRFKTSSDSTSAVVGRLIFEWATTPSTNAPATTP